MAGYIPRSDADFLAWSQTFSIYILAHAVDLGLVPADTTPIATALATFETAFTDHNIAQGAAQSARSAKQTARQAAEGVIRALVRRLQASPAVDDAERAAMGITVPDTIPSEASMPATRPVGVVDTAERLRHTIRFSDEASPTSKARPAGTMGCEIWVKISPAGQPAPTDPSELAFLGLDTASPYLAEYPGTEAGKTAHYMLRWVSTSGEKGPWSETVSATITG